MNNNLQQRPPNHPQKIITPIKTLTIASCFYVLSQAKFPKEQYVEWLTNFLNIIKYNPHIYLVIYTDSYSYSFLPQLTHSISTVAIRIKSLDQFYMYKYAEQWRKNHEQNYALRTTTGWELNMLWSEKLWFLRDVIKNHAFPDTPFYAWCDAGYFRNRINGPLNERDLHTGNGIGYMHWANPRKMATLDPTKIYYALVNSNARYIHHLKQLIQNKNPYTNLPQRQIPANQVSIGGGFCLLSPNLIDDWCKEYEYKLEDYFRANITVKDDQIILANCIFSHDQNKERFFLILQTPKTPYDSWFVFQRFLMS